MSTEALGRIGPAAKDAAPAALALLEGNEPAFVQSAACEALKALSSRVKKDDIVAVLKGKTGAPGPLVRAHRHAGVGASRRR